MTCVIIFEVITEIKRRYLYIVNLKSFSPPHRCPLAQRAAWGSGTRPCRGPSANAAAVFPPCGVWTPPPRGRQRGTLQSIRQASHRCPFLIAVFVLQFDPSVIYWSLLQVFVDGMEPAKKPLARMFEDSASEKSVRSPMSWFCIFFLQLKLKYQLELHCERCLSCKEKRKTLKHVGNGALTLTIPLSLLKLSTEQTAVAWHSQQCSSCRLIPHLCCLLEIPWKKKTPTGPSDKALWLENRLWALKDPGGHNAMLPLFIPLRPRVGCFLISFGAVVYLHSGHLLPFFFFKHTTWWNLIYWWLTAVSCNKVFFFSTSPKTTFSSSVLRIRGALGLKADSRNSKCQTLFSDQCWQIPISSLLPVIPAHYHISEVIGRNISLHIFYHNILVWYTQITPIWWC